MNTPVNLRPPVPFDTLFVEEVRLVVEAPLGGPTSSASTRALG
jgi:hypothetical protein